MGMSSPEWSRYLHDEAGLDEPPEEISAEVVDRMLARYRDHLPLLPGALDAVSHLAAVWPLAVASSSNRPLIEAFLDAAEVRGCFAATVSSEEVAAGKPAPDVFLEAARRLGVEPTDCAAVEDSANGLRAAAAAGMLVVAMPNPHYPPAPEALALAAHVLDSLDELTPELLAS